MAELGGDLAREPPRPRPPGDPRAGLDLARQLLFDRRPVKPEHSSKVHFRSFGQVLDRSGTVELDVRGFEPHLGQFQSIEPGCVARLHARGHVPVDLESLRALRDLRRVVKVEPQAEIPEIASGRARTSASS